MSTETAKETLTIPRKKKTSKSSKSKSDLLLNITTASLDDDKAQDVVVIKLAGKTSFADFMVIASGTSQRHVATMAQHIRENLKAEGTKDVGIEGTEQNDWVLIDGGDVIVHLFRPEIREFYDLEKIWGDSMPQPDEAALV